MDVYVTSVMGPCTEFLDENKKKQEISVVISPLKITGDEKNLKVSSGCNMWRGCQNLRCQYSMSGLVNREGKR